MYKNERTGDTQEMDTITEYSPRMAPGTDLITWNDNNNNKKKTKQKKNTSSSETEGTNNDRKEEELQHRYRLGMVNSKFVWSLPYSIW